MALVLADRVQETTTTTGTGSITLAGAVPGFQSFAVVGNTNTCYYAIVDANAWEVGIGTYSTTGPTLARTTILSNSLGTLVAITLTAGTKNVFLTYPAERAITGPSSSTASGIVLFDGATGNIVKDSSATDGLIQGLTVGLGGGAVAANTAFGVSALGSNTTGYANTAIGQFALAANVDAINNTAVGKLAGNRTSTGSGNTYVGYSAGQYNQTGSNNTALGADALGVGPLTSYSDNTAVGSASLYAITTGIRNTAIGYLSGSGITTGGKNVVIGSYTGAAAPISATGSNYIVFSDGDANVRGYFNNTGVFNIASLTASKAVFTDASKNLVSTGTLGIDQGGTGQTTANAAFNALVPSQTGNSGKYLTTDGTNTSWATNAAGDVVGPASSTANGIALFDGTTGKLLKDSAAQDGLIYGLTVGRGNSAIVSNTAFGVQALNANTTGSTNTALGWQAGIYNLSGSNNTAVGAQALFGSQTGAQNVALGTGSLYTNDSGSNNIAIGFEAIKLNTSSGNNVAVGHQALYNNNATVSAGSFVVGVIYRITIVGTTNFTLIGAASNTVGAIFTATGVGSGSGSAEVYGSAGNTAVGYLSGYANTGGTGNTLFGYASGASVTFGGKNAFFGYNAGTSVTTGGKNVIIGSYAGLIAPISMTGSNYIIFSDGDANVRGYFDSTGVLNIANLTASKPVFTDASKNLVSTGTLGVDQGGTGLTTTPANGALDIGNGTGFTRTTLTAGSGVTITNASGSITINATGTGGDVVGPASATNNALARFDGTTGKLIKDSSGLTYDGTTFVAKSNAEFGDSLVDANRYVNIIGAGGNKDFGIQLSGSRVLWQNTGQSGLLFGVSDTEQMRLTSTGLGIGTSSPAFKLQVIGASNMQVNAAGTQQVLQLNNSDITAGTQAVKLGFSSAGVTKASINAAVYGNDYMTFNVGSDTERMRIDSSGNVGIGTNSPATKLNLAMASGAGTPQIRFDQASDNPYIEFDRWTGTASDYNGARIYVAGGSPNLVFSVAGTATTIGSLSFTERMRLDSSGNLGIGTSSPLSKLDVRAANATMGNYQTIQAFTTDTATVDYGGGISLGGNYSGTSTLAQFASIAGRKENGTAGNYAGYLQFGTNSQATGVREVMRLDSSGNLGLGVTPSAWTSYQALQVNTGATLASTANQMVLGSNWYFNSGDKYVTTDYSTLYIQNSGQHKWYNAPSGTAGNAITFTQAMTLDASGNLGVGTTSPDIFGRFYTRSVGISSSGTTSLQINGSTYGTLDVGAGGTRTGSFVGSASEVQLSTITAIPLLFVTNSLERARIDSSGNFGIGGGLTAYNNAKLTVVTTATATRQNLAAIDKTTANWVRFTNPQFSTDSSMGLILKSFPDSDDRQGAGIIASGGATNNSTNLSLFVTASDAVSFAAYTATPAGTSLDHTWNKAAGSTAMTLDASGNLEIGGTFAQGRKLGVDSSTNGYTMQLLQTSAFNSGNLAGTVYSGYYDGSNITDMASIRGGKENTTSGNFGGMLAFYTRANGGSDTERARIDSSGNLLVGTTSYAGVGISITTADNNGCYSDSANTAARNHWRFSNPNGVVGSIQTSASLTLYNTTSDYRLKNITGPITNSGSYIDSLNPVEGTWKADGSTFVGLIAHEAQEASRTQVATGIKDGTEMQAMDYSNSELIANLIAEVKSLRKRLADAGI